MPNDAKLGMVFGVALVILVAVLFFRREPANPAAAESAPAAVAQATPAPTPGARSTGAPANARKHLTRAGETLTALARHYLGDEARAAELRSINPQLPADTDDLQPGLEIVLPDGAAATPPPEPPEPAEKSGELPQ
jgi:hypothetical protein